jgi:hypothetical protein
LRRFPRIYGGGFTALKYLGSMVHAERKPKIVPTS